MYVIGIEDSSLFPFLNYFILIRFRYYIILKYHWILFLPLMTYKIIVIISFFMAVLRLLYLNYNET